MDLIKQYSNMCDNIIKNNLLIAIENCNVDFRNCEQAIEYFRNVKEAMQDYFWCLALRDYDTCLNIEFEYKDNYPDYKSYYYIRCSLVDNNSKVKLVSLSAKIIYIEESNSVRRLIKDISDLQNEVEVFIENHTLKTQFKEVNYWGVVSSVNGKVNKLKKLVTDGRASIPLDSFDEEVRKGIINKNFNLLD